MTTENTNVESFIDKFTKLKDREFQWLDDNEQIIELTDEITEADENDDMAIACVNIHCPQIPIKLIQKSNKVYASCPQCHSAMEVRRAVK